MTHKNSKYSVLRESEIKQFKKVNKLLKGLIIFNNYKVKLLSELKNYNHENRLGSYKIGRKNRDTVAVLA